jgi:hypothetical protein
MRKEPSERRAPLGGGPRRALLFEAPERRGERMVIDERYAMSRLIRLDSRALAE